MKKLTFMLTVLFILLTAVSVSATNDYSADINDTEPATNIRQLARLTDNADLLTSNEEATLLMKLDEISERQSFDVAIITVSNIDQAYSAIGDYADDVYDYYGFGMGASRDGCLFVISMEERDWYISTCGYGITALTDAGIEFIGDEVIAAGLSDGEYAIAFDKFASLCDKFVTQAKTGEPYDSGNLPYEYNPFLIVVVAPIFGVIVSLVIVNKMKKKMISVTLKNEANDYVARDSVNITKTRDVFTYSNVTKTKIVTESSNNGGGGSSTHVSSSGETHGGGGGKF